MRERRQSFMQPSLLTWEKREVIIQKEERRRQERVLGGNQAMSLLIEFGRIPLLF